MDSSVSNHLITRWYSKNSVRLLTLASITVAILAMLHVSHQQANAPMQELLQGCELKTPDLHRLQLAFGQSGLNDFKVKDGTVWVPRDQHSSYLTAATEHNAIPAEFKLTKDLPVSDAGNPFLSRSQREYLKHLRQKNQVQEMIIRLPFVEQAWCEMDQTPRQNAFSNIDRSAVLSIRSTPECQLSVAHVDTIKQMVAAAITDLTIENVVVIDLNNGFAHQDNIDQLSQKQRELHQITVNQKHFYESRLQELLLDYPGVDIRVDVTVNEVLVDVEPTTNTANTLNIKQPAVPSAGANGVVSIETEAPELPVLVSHEIQTIVELNKQLHVFVDIPTETVYAALGNPVEIKKHISARERQASIDQQTKAKFEQLKSTIADRLLPLFPSESTAGSLLTEQGNSVDFRLVPAIAQAKNTADWKSNAQALFESNWPSLGVLGIGALLLALVYRRSDQFRSPANQQSITPEYGPTDSGTSQQSVCCAHDAASENLPEIQSAPDAEVQLTKLIQEDPDSAAKIIETWIRDAA